MKQDSSVFPQESISDLMAEWVQATPDAAALIYQDRPLSFSALDEQGRRLARGLADLGVGPGDRVAFWLPNTPAYVALWLACCRLGAIAVAVNTRFRSAEVSDILHRSGAKLLVLWPDFRGIDFLGILEGTDPAAMRALEAVVIYDEGEPERALPGQLGHCRRIAYRALAGSALQNEHPGTADSGCNIFTTSGTTKAPKMVLHRQAGLCRHGRIVAERWGYRKGDGAFYLALPFCGVFGFAQLLVGLASGRPTVIAPSFDAAQAIADMDRWQVRYLNAGDSMVQALLEATARTPALPTVRECGVAMFNSYLADIAEVAERRGLTLFGLYGMSEVLALFSRRDPALPLPERGVAGGVPADPLAVVRVRDPESGELLGHGETGELEFKGPSVMAEYFRDPEATAETFTEDGFLRSGDLGFTEPGGGFAYLSRMGDVLRLGGFLVSPQEIEAYLQGHASVAAAQVVGVETEKGLRPVGFVVPEAGAAFDEAALLAHCAKGLARFKVPARIFSVAEFPSTTSANGTKIQRGRLRQMAQESLARS